MYVEWIKLKPVDLQNIRSQWVSWQHKRIVLHCILLSELSGIRVVDSSLTSYTWSHGYNLIQFHIFYIFAKQAFTESQIHWGSEGKKNFICYYNLFDLHTWDLPSKHTMSLLSSLHLNCYHPKNHCFSKGELWPLSARIIY